MSRDFQTSSWDAAPPRLDETDNHILAVLWENSREFFADVCWVVGLSTPAARRRTERLKQDDAIEKFAIMRGDERAGAMVLVLVESGRDAARMSDGLAHLDGVRGVYEITGQYDMAVMVRAHNISCIGARIDSRRESPGIKDVNPMIRN